MSGLLKNLLFALGLAVILWVGYVVFFQNDEEDLSAQNAQLASEAARDTQDFLVKLQRLRDIDFENTLFSDQRFQSLIDHRQPVVSEPVGRENPFAPITGTVIE